MNYVTALISALPVMRSKMVPADWQETRMCEKCREIDLKIEHYRSFALGPADNLARQSIKILIEDLEAEKAALHVGIR